MRPSIVSLSLVITFLPPVALAPPSNLDVVSTKAHDLEERLVSDEDILDPEPSAVKGPQGRGLSGGHL